MLGDRAFSFCLGLREVILEPGARLESIGSNCFFCCKLAEIVIPKSVHRIKNNAFASCKRLSSLRLEDGSQLSSIGAGAFYDTKLTPESVKYPETLKTDGREYRYPFKLDEDES